MITSIVAFVFVLGVLIFVHELGHYLMAKRIGVRVLTFSLGFGPKILRFRRGDTEYCVSAIPLGGYVKMAGENPDDPRTGKPDEFLSKTKWQRFQVMIMGPTMNILLAIVVMTVVLYTGADVPAYEQDPVVIGSVLEKSAGARAGIRPGDRIVSLDGRAVATWEEFSMAVMPKARREVQIVVERGGRQETLRVTPDAQTRFEVGDIGVLPKVRPQIISVWPDHPAAKAGLQARDVIVAVNGVPVEHEQLISTIRQSVDRPLTITVERGGTRRDFQVTPAKRGDLGMIGVDLNPYELRRIEPGPLQAVVLSLKRNWEWSDLIFRTLWGLLTRETSPKQLMGPVAIAQLSGGAARVGWIPLFTLMAMISLNLGILNLLPIPVLDGGHIFIMALEGISRRDFSVRMKEKMLLAGFVVLMMLMVTVIYNDLMRIEWIEKIVPWR
jgi:regulator of sigma E protease